MPLFVSFQDDDVDPTFAYADEAILVDARDDDDNPCVGPGVRRTAHLVPRTAAEIKVFASVLGWSVETGSDGNLVLYPGVSAEDDEDTDEDA